MKIRIVLSLVTIITIGACNSSLEDPQSVAPDEIMSVSAETSTLSANGKDRTKLIVRIPREANLIDVSFSTTAGVFLMSNDITINQLADSIAGNYRFATTILVADSIPGTAYITTEALSARRRISITFN